MRNRRSYRLTPVDKPLEAQDRGAAPGQQTGRAAIFVVGLSGDVGRRDVARWVAVAPIAQRREQHPPFFRPGVSVRTVTRMRAHCDDAPDRRPGARLNLKSLPADKASDWLPTQMA